MILYYTAVGSVALCLHPIGEEYYEATWQSGMRMIWIQILFGYKYKLIAMDQTFWYHVIIGTNHGRCVLGTSNPFYIVSSRPVIQRAQAMINFSNNSQYMTKNIQTLGNIFQWNLIRIKKLPNRKYTFENEVCNLSDYQINHSKRIYFKGK